MRIINRPQTDPYFNIAAEEYLLKSMDEDCFMLWRNQPSVIVGKHQNTLAEINYQWIRENHIPVIRRISGGGTVFHDPGNINYTFIASGARDKLVNFKKFMQPIIDVLENLGLPARFEGKNDIRIKGLKVSGNAEHVYKNRVLHHGTLLFNAQLDLLNEAIKVKEGRFADKAVQSIRSKVVNISDLLKDKISIDQFMRIVIEHIKNSYPNCEIYNMTADDLEGIEKLANEKYKTWDWNFGYSPDYKLDNKQKFNDIFWELKLEVIKGLITRTVLIKNDKIHPQNEQISSLLIGKKHNFADVSEILKESKFLSLDVTNEMLVKLLF